MQYFGGKFRTGKRIADYLSSVREQDQLYVEPFVGSAWVLQYMSNPRQASDIHEDLILLYKALLDGWEPPTSVSEGQYNALKTSRPSALRAFAGFGCSWGGKWFGGYARDNTSNRNYASNAHNSLMKQVPHLVGAEFTCDDYQKVRPEGTLMYLDPPYAGTTQYSNGMFDTTPFWEYVRQVSESNRVVVSEYTAPENFTVVAEFKTHTDVRTRSGGKSDRIERLFEYSHPIKHRRALSSFPTKKRQ